MTTSNKPCPECRESGHDSTGDHLWLMGDGKTWTCDRVEYHKSGKVFYDPPYSTTDKSRRERSSIMTKETIPYVKKLPQSKWIRDLHPDTVIKYGVHVEVDGTGKPNKHFYPIYDSSENHIGYEVRVCNPKGFYKTCSGKTEVKLGGWQTGLGITKPEHLIITEGYLDAMAVCQTLKNKGVTSFVVYSLQNGAGGGIKSLRDNLPDVKKASNIYFYPDQDKPGKKLISKVVALLPSIKIMETSEKDACDMLKEGKSAELYTAFAKATRYKPSSIISASEAKSAALVKPLWGLEYPFEKLHEMTYGARVGRLIGLGAGPGAGKTVFIKAIQTHLMYAHKEKIGVFSLEETPGEALREIAGYVMNKPLDRPDCVYDEDELERVLDSFDGLATIYDTDNYETWQDIEEAIRYMASTGVRWIFIDPLSVLTTHLSSSEANQYLNEAMFKMSKLVKKLGITIFHVNHLNNANSGIDHGEGGAVKASQFTGSRAQWKYSTDIWGLMRDQYNDDPIIRNTTEVVSLKYRKPSKPGRFELLYDETLGTLTEVKPTF